MKRITLLILRDKMVFDTLQLCSIIIYTILLEFQKLILPLLLVKGVPLEKGLVLNRP